MVTYSSDLSIYITDLIDQSKKKKTSIVIGLQYCGYVVVVAGQSHLVFKSPTVSQSIVTSTEDFRLWRRETGRSESCWRKQSKLTKCSSAICLLCLRFFIKKNKQQKTFAQRQRRRGRRTKSERRESRYFLFCLLSEIHSITLVSRKLCFTLLLDRRSIRSILYTG